MNERFTSVFFLGEDLYADGAPLLIASGTLFRDNMTGGVLAQLRLKNLDGRTLRAVKLRLQPGDTAGRMLGEPMVMDYLDLNVPRGASFGAERLIPMPDYTTRSFRVEILEAIYTEGFIWTAPEDLVWAPLPPAIPLESRVKDADLLRELRGQMGENCRFLPARYEQLWRCACGEPVLGENCPLCGRTFFTPDFAAMETARSQRLMAQREAALRAEADAAIRARAAKREKAEAKSRARARWKKLGRVLAVLIPVLLLVAAGVLLGIPALASHRAEKAAQAETQAPQETPEPTADPAAETAAAYEKALALQAEGQYEAAAAAFEALGDYEDSAERLRQCEGAILEERYLEALVRQQNGEYEEAAALFEALGDYKDSAEQAAFARKQQEISGRLRNAEVGEYVTFGACEQDNITANGKEPIEWLVLAKEEDRILVVSRYALDCMQLGWGNWEYCQLRRWLNGSFLEETFSAEEQARILLSPVTAEKNPRFKISPGNDTEDWLFLLSISEVERYFASAEARRCAPTDYAIAQGAYTYPNHRVDGRAACWWWLRSPKACIGGGGIVSDCDMTDSNVAVRPAMWISFTASAPATETNASVTVPEIPAEEEAEIPAEEEAEIPAEEEAEIPAEEEAEIPAEEEAEIPTEEETQEGVAVGSTVIFGAYEQDNDTANGKEPIEWLVLAKEGDRILVVSKYALDCKPHGWGDWERSTLRGWLNHDFLEEAFSAEEQARIPVITVTADKNPKYDTSPGNDTVDQVFLLSVPEVERYFASAEARRCVPTDYAIACGAYTYDNHRVDGRAACWWWLRSPGDYAGTAACISGGGVVSKGQTDDKHVAVRPALWIEPGA